MESAWALPIAAGIGGIGQGLAGAAGGDSGERVGFDRLGGLSFPQLYQRGLRNIEHMGGVATSRAEQPVSLPSAFVQPLPQFAGPHVSVTAPALDPALVRPDLLGAPGIRFGAPQPGQEGSFPEDDRVYPQGAGRWLFPGAPRWDPSGRAAFEAAGVGAPMYQGIRQPSRAAPKVGGGFGELGAALTLLGVDTDALGNLSIGGELPLFAGAERRGNFGIYGNPPANPLATPGGTQPDTQPRKNYNGNGNGNNNGSVDDNPNAIGGVD